MKTEININRVIVFLIITFLVGGCAAPVSRKPLAPQLIGLDHLTIGGLSGIDKEITIHYKGTYAHWSQGLLTYGLNAAINQVQKSSAEELIKPLLEATSDIDFRTLYMNELDKTFSASPWLKISKPDKRSIGDSEEGGATLKAPFLLLIVTYRLSSDAQALFINTMTMYSINSSEEVDYCGIHTYVSKDIGNKSDNAEKAIQLWAANDAESYRQVIAEGIKESIKMLKLDLKNKPADLNTEGGEEVSVRGRSYYTHRITTHKGKVITRNNGRICLREDDGDIVSIPMGLEE